MARASILRLSPTKKKIQYYIQKYIFCILIMKDNDNIIEYIFTTKKNHKYEEHTIYTHKIFLAQIFCVMILLRTEGFVVHVGAYG